MASMNPKYTQAIWDFTEMLQQETQMENGLHNCLEIMKDTIDCESGYVWLLEVVFTSEVRQMDEQFCRQSRQNFAGILCGFQEILTQSGGKRAVQMVCGTL